MIERGAAVDSRSRSGWPRMGHSGRYRGSLNKGANNLHVFSRGGEDVIPCVKYRRATVDALQVLRDLGESTLAKQVRTVAGCSQVAPRVML